MTDWEPSKDGDWIDIQHNTFLNWVNQQLKTRETEIHSLATDLGDGINLINLIEVAAGGQKTVGKYNKQIRIQTHKLENTQIALNFLVREGVKIVNIGNEDIVNGNLKLILGLIWTLILRYHITKGQDGRSAKNDLLRWVRSKIPEYNIKNFTTDWNDGKAICALTNAVGPGLCPGHRDLKGQPIENAKKGIDLAQKRLDIPPVLGPEDMVNRNVDELSVMTYIQYFRNACMNEAPIPTAEGPGLIAGKVGEPAHYTIFRNNADGDLTTEVIGPNGPAKTEMVDNEDGTYSVTYYPKESGKFTAYVRLEGENIPNSPYFPIISADINLVKAYGPGLIGGKVGKPGLFTVEPNGHNGVLDIKIKGPKGPVPVKFEKNPQGNYDCRYDPTVSGIHDVDITMDGEEIPENPWHPLIEADVSKIRAHGPGLIRGKVGVPAKFVVEPNGNDGNLTITVNSPKGPVPIKFEKNASDNYDCVYDPDVSGDYVVDIKMNGEDIPENKFHPIIDPDVSKIRAHGPGLVRGKVGVPAKFVVEPNGNDGNLTIAVNSPKGPVPIKFEKNPEGNYDCVYDPEVSGNYVVDIKMNDQDIPENKFHPIIDIDASRIRAHGPGLVRGKVGSPAKFVVEPNGNDGNLTIAVNSPKGPVPIKFEKNPQGNYDCVYNPEVSGDYVVDIKMDDQDIPENQFHPIIDLDVSRIRAHGPGLVRGKVGSPAKFVVEPNGNEGDLTIAVNSPKGPVPIKFEKNPQGNYDCVYDPEVSGDYVVDIKMNDQDIPENKFHPIIDLDLNRIRAHGPGLVRGKVGSPAKFVVEPNGNDGNLTIAVNSPKGPVPIKFEKNPEGNYDCVYDPEVSGDYVVDIKMDGQDIPENKFHPKIDPDVTRVRAYGPGLEEGMVNEPAPFKVDVYGQNGELKIVVESPEGPIPCTAVRREDGDYDCQYVPQVPGEYLIDIKMDDQDVPDSPFYVVINDDFRNVRCAGPGIEGGFAGIPTDFTVFPNGHVGKLKVWIQGPEDPAVCVVTKNEDGTYLVEYTPEVPGEYYINVTMDDRHVPGSPFLIIVMPKKRSGPSLGGEGKIRVFYTSTSAMERVKKNQKKLQDVLEKRGVNKRPDFEPWISLDVGMEKGFRDMIFAKAGRREPPLMFIDDEPTPTCEELFKMDDEGTFDDLLKYMPKFDK